MGKKNLGQSADVEVRLACLAKAVESAKYCDGGLGEDILSSARKYYDFVNDWPDENRTVGQLDD